MLDKPVSWIEQMSKKWREDSEKLKVKYKNVIITEQEAIKIAKEYRQHKEYAYVDDWENKISVEFLKSENYEYSYEIDWEHPRIRLERKSLKKNGSLSSGFGKKILVWHIWFLPMQGIDLNKGLDKVGVDIDARTGKVFTKYSLDKL